MITFTDEQRAEIDFMIRQAILLERERASGFSIGEDETRRRLKTPEGAAFADKVWQLRQETNESDHAEVQQLIKEAIENKDGYNYRLLMSAFGGER